MISYWMRLGAGTAVLSMCLSSAPAKACECAGLYAVTVWPRDGALEVARDTPIVIERQNFYGATSDVEIVLANAQGERIALEEVRVLPQRAPDCSSLETVFLRPVAALEAGAQYTLDFEYQGDAGEQLVPRPTAFTVGDAMYEASAAELEVTYLHVAPAPETACTEECDVAEILLAADGPVATPYWLAIKSDAAADDLNRMRLVPSAWLSTRPRHPDTAQASVDLPIDDRCVEIAVYGIDGVALVEEERCTPDLCAVFSANTFNDCGGPTSTTLDVLRLSHASCDDPFVVPSDRYGNATYEDAGVVAPDSGLDPATQQDAAAQQDAGSHEAAGSHADAGVPAGDGMDASAAERDDGGEASSPSAGCGVLSPRRSTSAFYVWLALAALAALVRRRRRCFEVK